ncbi:MAG: GAF domain-containing protein [Deltaproteobacteria bacterium]|nr:GAF domain-containing protein [Deltaproteobacteria bacterium]
MPRFLFSSLRVRLIILVLVAVLPGVALTIHEVIKELELNEAMAQHEALTLLREVSDHHNQIIHGARQLLTGLAQLPQVRNHDSRACATVLAGILKQFPFYTSLAAVKPNGYIFCSPVPPEAPGTISDRTYFQEVLRTRDFAVSEYLIESATGKPNITIAYPAVDKSGVVQAVVFVGLGLDWLNEPLARFQLPQGSEITLMNDQATILARYPGGEGWVGKGARDAPIVRAIFTQRGGGTAQAAGVDGVHRFYVFGTLTGLDPRRSVYLSIGIPKEIVFSGYMRTLYRDITLMAITAILALAAVWVAGNRLVKRPVDDMIRATKRMAAGDLSARTGLVHGEGELNQLARSFDQMADSLEQNITEIKRAEERTHRHLTELTSLREIDQAMTSTLDLHTVLDLLLGKIDLLFPQSACTIRLFDQETGELEPVACRNLDEKEWKRERWKSRGLPAIVFQTKGSLISNDVSKDPRVRDPEFFVKNGLISYLGVPLLARDKILGVISFYTKEEREFSNEEVEFFSALAGQAAVAIRNSQLFEQIKEQAEDLQKINVQLETASKVKNEFLSVMSHELRTPLTVVMGYTDMVRDGLLGEINKNQKEALAKVAVRAGDLLSMIKDVLQATQVETQAIIIEGRVVHLTDFLDKLKLAYDAPLDKEITLIWDYPSDLPSMMTDSEKLRQILQNLIHNAIKFTNKGSVTVSARIRHEAEGNRRQEEGLLTPLASRLAPHAFVEFRVADTGVGIPKEMLPVIFEKFRQVDSSETRLYGGVGLGLYIVKKFTELLGGTVQVESEPGKGSTFTVTLPLEN